MSEVFTLTGEPAPPKPKKWNTSHGNPCVKLYGPGPAGAICKTCEYLFSHSTAKTYYKCAMRGKPTHGPGTDHRVKWPACARYKAAETKGDM